MPTSIMLVDDDEDLRSLMKRVLEKAGFVVYEAADGDQALELVTASVPDIFIVDVMMPGISGYELCQQLRADPRTAQRIIFVLSARSDRESVEEGLQAGADRYLVKPIPPELIVSYINAAMKGRTA